MALTDAAEKLWKEIEASLRQKTKISGKDANGNDVYDMKKYNSVRDVVTPENLIALYKKMVAKEDIPDKLRKMAKVMSKLDMKWNKKSLLFAELEKYRGQLISGKGSWNSVFSRFETSGWSVMATIAQKLNWSLHQPENLAAKYSGFWADTHTALLVKDLLIVPALLTGYNAVVGNDWTMQNLLRDDTSIWVMAIAPILASNTPWQALSALAIVAGASTGFTYAYRLFKGGPLNLQSAMTLWLTGFVGRNETFTQLFIYSVSISLLRLPLVKKILGFAARHVLGNAMTNLSHYWDWLMDSLGFRNSGWLSRGREQVVERLASWFHLPVDVTSNFFKAFWKAAVKIGIGYIASLFVNNLLETSAYGPDNFINFSFILSALAGNNEMLLVNVLMTFAFRTGRFFGAHEIHELPAIEAPSEKKKEEKNSALSKSDADPWTVTAADAVRANREFENVVCSLFSDDAEHLREIFEELRLASSGLMNQLVDFTISGDERLLPRSDDFGMTPPPIAFSRFTTAVRALLTALSQPLHGHRHFKTDEDDPDKAEPISFAEQIGADQIQKVRHVLTQSFYRMNVENGKAGAHFDGKNKKTKPQRKQERRQRHEERVILPYDNEPKFERAHWEAVHTTSGSSNFSAFRAFLLSTCAMVARAASATHSYFTQTIRLSNKGREFTMNIPTILDEQPRAFTEAIADLHNINAPIDFGNPLNLYVRFEEFLNRLQDEGLLTADGTPVTRESVRTYLSKQTFSNPNLRDLATLRRDDTPEAVTILSNLHGNYETMIGYFTEYTNKVSDFITLSDHQPNPPTPSPPAPTPSPPVTTPNTTVPSPSVPTPNTTVPQRPLPVPTMPPPVQKTTNSSTLEQISKGSSLSQIWGSAKEFLKFCIPSVVQDNPAMMTHLLLHSAVDYYDIGRYALTEREYLLADRVRPSWKWGRDFVLNAGPLLLDMVLQSVYQTSFLSNSERYYFALQAGVDVYAKIKAWWYWRKTARDTSLNLLQGKSAETVEIYHLLQLQRALPLVSFIAMRNVDPTTADLVSLLLTKGVSLFASSLISAHIVRFLHQKRIFPVPFNGYHWMQPFMYSLPALVSLSESPSRLAMIALVSYAMNVRADFHVRTKLLRLGLAAIIAYEACSRDERAREVVVNMARGYLKQVTEYLAPPATPTPPIPTAKPMPRSSSPQDVLILYPNFSLPVNMSNAAVLETRLPPSSKLSEPVQFVMDNPL
jgi:hypothetical protein